MKNMPSIKNFLFCLNTNNSNGTNNVNGILCAITPEYVPAVIPDHDYHAEIFDDFQKTPLSSLKALVLADSCKAVTFESNIAWVSPIKKV